jgi:hypothetical protein
LGIIAGLAVLSHLCAREAALQTPPAASSCVNLYPIPKWLQINHIEGKGLGYERGYTKLTTVLGPEYRVGRFLPLLQLNGAVFDDGKASASVGFLGRFLSRSFCEVFGLNLFYDFRQGKQGNYNQVSGGLDILNKRWEVHAMGRFPVGNKVHSKAVFFHHYLGPYFFITREYEYAIDHVDLTAGYYPVLGKSFQLYASAGPYYLFGKFNASAFGVKAMIRPQYKDYFSLELSISHDRIFQTIYQVNVVISVPLYAYSSSLKHKKGPCGVSNRQIYQPVDPDIALNKKFFWRANF